MFEIRKTDLAGRIGIIRTNHGNVETPAYVPVIHPVRQTIPAADLRAMGFDLVITNAYITRKRLASRAARTGIHDILKYDGAVMTDSGGYQVLEYGDLDVNPAQMAEFEREIMTDFAIPLDKPTGFGMPRRDAEAYVRHTLKISRQTLASSQDNGQIWIGPVQGGEHLDLVGKSAKSLVRAGFPMLALGSPVEFMESYRYGELARMIGAAKRSMPHSVPLHLFGAGHPLTIPLAVALGCDTFDSASYMLYAKHQRYITSDGTRHLKEIAYFPCGCPICSKHSPSDLLERPDRTELLAMHNLHAIRLEVERVKQAIHEGRLWEYVMKKARAHPRLFEAVGVLTDSHDLLAAGTAKFKAKAAFLYSAEDQFRPEVVAYHQATRGFRTRKKIVLITKEGDTKPGYLSGRYGSIPEHIQVCQYNPVLGIIPIEISDLYPAAHHETARVRFRPEDMTMFAQTWEKFFENNNFEEVRYDESDPFLAHFTNTLPKGRRKHPAVKNKKKKSFAKVC